MALADNKEKIQIIIKEINSLPNAAGSGNVEKWTITYMDNTTEEKEVVVL